MTQAVKIRPPSLPASYVDWPVTLHEAQQATASVKDNGNRLQLALKGLMLYNALSLLLGVVGPFLFMKYLPDFIRSFDPTTSAADFEAMRREMPLWLAPLLSVLYALMPAVNIWCLNVLRRAVQAVQGWTLMPTPEAAAEVTRRLLQVRPWVTLGQWLPILFGGFIVLFMVVMLVAVGSDAGSDAGLGMMVMIPFYLIPLGIWAVVSWLLLAAVKRWLDAVLTRTGTPSFPVRPFARSLDGWLIFLLVMIGLGTLQGLASVAMMAFFPSFMTLMLSSDLTLKADAEVFRQMGKFMQGFAWLGLLGVLSYVLTALATYWTRAFTNDVARVLDASRPAQVQPPQAVVPADW